MRAALIAPLLVLGCAGPPRRTMHRTELGIGGSLAGMMASSGVMVALPAQKPILIPITIGFGALAVVSVVLYCIAYGNLDEPKAAPAAPPPPPPNPAWPLTQQAQAAARAGECEEVRKLDAQVRELDPDFHAVVFARDVAIQRCLQN